MTNRRRLLLSVAIGMGVLPFFQYAVSAGVGITSRVDAALTTLQRVGARQPALAQAGAQAIGAPAGSDDAIWEVPGAAAVLAATRVPAGSGEGVVLRLNKAALDQFLFRAPMEDTSVRPEDQVIISLPLPDGRFSRFRIEESPMLAPELQSAFPEIRTYRIAGVDDATANGRIGWTALGFHAIIIAAGGSVYIDPSATGDTEHYVSLNKADLPRASEFVCLVNGAAARGGAPMVLPLSNGTLRRTYRLAVAATGEYTAAAGGTVPLALARMTATMNRVNGIYERELAVRMTLATGSAGSPTALIYTNASTDPYTNGNPGAMITQNQSNIDTVVGAANYDIGHVFGTDSGGLAGLGVVCALGNKARGVTGSSDPTGDAFDVDYVAHEIGHQFGGSHTFNGTTDACGGARSAAHAYEPGSGSTIMPYAGICDAEDLQRNSNDYFNVESLNEITTYLVGGGASCATTAATGNTVPTVTTPAAFTIPQQTPFTLTATGTASDVGDALTYTWEQYDLGGATTSPATIGTDDGSRPLFRSYSPTTSNTRTFPSLPFIRNNANVPPQTYTGASVVTPVVCSAGTCATGEVLPSTNRVMHFQVTARDNRAGGGGIRSAQTSITVTTAAGPFRVTAPNAAVKWKATSTQTVTWNVAGTSAAPVSAGNVRISLSTDGGLTFPTVILASTANDGTEDITVPNLPTTTARIKVEAVGNIFFDMSDVDFEIEPSPVELALVVDDTGSMAEEIGTVRTAMTNTIARLAAAAKPFPTTAIISFKDDVTTRIVSNDPVKLQAIVNALAASGGGDCPEAANAALIVAGNLLGASGTAMLFTDADARPDGPSRTDVLNVYLPKSLRLSVLLSGSCDESLRPGDMVAYSRPSDNHDSSWRPTAARLSAAGSGRDPAAPGALGPETSVRTFSELALETRGTFAAIPEVNDNADGVARYTNVATNVAVSAVLPAVSLLTPSVVPQGAVVRVEITGANTNFQGSSVVTVGGSGVAVVSQAAISSTRLLADLVVAAGAMIGYRDVTVTTNLGGSTTETALGGGSLQITAPPNGPRILGVTPFDVAQGATADILITGFNTHFVAGTTTVNLGPGVTINSVTVLGATTARANVTVSAAAVVGFRDVRVTTGPEIATENVTGPLLVKAPPAAISRVVRVSPAVGRPGTTRNVTLAGENTHFAAGTSTVAFSGAGITVNSVSVISATALAANITIAPGAPFGFRDVVVTTAAEVAVLFGGFNVSTTQLPFPHLLDLNGDRGGDVFLYNKSTGARRFELTSPGAGFAEIPGEWDRGWQVYPAALNSDGYTDLFLYDPVRGFWIQAINNAGDGTFTYTLGNWDNGWTVVPSDLDGDGVTDMFVYNFSTGVWVKCLVDGSGGFKGYTAGNWDPGWTFNTADLNGDSRDDFFLYNPTTGIWVEAFSQAGLGGFDYPASGTWDPGWQLYPADLDGDGLTDLFLLNAAGVHVTALSRPVGGFDYVGGPQWSPGWSVAAGDLDGDRRSDLFLYNPVFGWWVEAFSDGAGGFTYSPVGAWDPGWTVGVTDLNDDAIGDIVLTRPDGTWIQATNTGVGSFTYTAGNWGTGWTVFTKRLGDR